MIHVNGKHFEWKDGMNLFDVFRVLGYTLARPSVLVHVDGAIVRKDQWNRFVVEDGSTIEIVNLLRGG